ncbi:MAG: family 10 glycosylhydrolase [Gemmatimonadaceae bacterium]
MPALPREFRGLWIATVANIDWPSKSGLTTAAQQAELRTILDVALTTGLNVIVLQVRASGDALYRSSLEPWSRSLTGTQGVDPGWDPLAFAVTEAHDRGLELHAWFNPFRAGNLSDTTRLDPTHFAKRRPDLARYHCTQLWFDPGEQAVQDQAINVIQDVVRRYAVDAVHLDDFFYPYPDTRCPNLSFADSSVYARYQAAGGVLARDDWRRDNVNRFVERLYRDVHLIAPSVRVGISPFGIWRPGNPAGIVGLDAFASIYADSRLWLQRGWVDYFAPQLYWSIASTGQSFPSLLDWWTLQNTQRRHLWPGLAAYRVADGSSSAYASSEIASQVSFTRTRSAVSGGPTGNVLYNTTSVRLDRGGLATLLRGGVFAAPALVPATPWLDATVPAPPTVSVVLLESSPPTLRVTISGDGGEPLAWWVVRWRNAGTWSMRTVPAGSRVVDIPGIAGSAASDAVAVHSVDRVGNASEPAMWSAK